VIRVDAVMSPCRPGNGTTGCATIPSGATIEDGLRAVAHAPEADLAVVAPTGEPIGSVSLRQLAGALVSPSARPVQVDALVAV
jgi:glycine betaine/proline transport system ATP-binding protein